MSVLGDKGTVSDIEGGAPEDEKSIKSSRAASVGDAESDRETLDKPGTGERTRFGFLKRRTRKFPADRSDKDVGDQAILVENEETEPQDEENPPGGKEGKEEPEKDVIIVEDEEKPKEEEGKRRLRYFPARIKPLGSKEREKDVEKGNPPDDVEDQSGKNGGPIDGDEADNEEGDGDEDPGRLTKFRRRVSDKIHNAEFKRPDLKNPFRKQVEEPGTPEEFPPVEGESQTAVIIPAYPMKPSYINYMDMHDNNHHHSGLLPVHNGGVAIQAGPHPLTLECPNCRCIVNTYIQRRSGAYAWWVCLVFLMLGFLFFCLPWLCSCCPFCNRTYKDVEHYCPKCHACVGRYKRVQWFCC